MVKVAGSTSEELFQFVVSQVSHEFNGDGGPGGRRKFGHPSHGAVRVKLAPLAKKRGHGSRPVVLREFRDPICQASIERRFAGFGVNEEVDIRVEDGTKRRLARVFRRKMTDELSRVV